MKKLLFFAVLLLGFAACKYEDMFRYIEWSPIKIDPIVIGEPYQVAFNFSDPIYLTDITYSEVVDNKSRDVDTKHIARTYYEHPPYKVDWEGLHVEVPNLYTIKVTVDADCRPTEIEKSFFYFKLDAAERIEGDFSTIWQWSDIVIYRTQPAEE